MHNVRPLRGKSAGLYTRPKPSTIIIDIAIVFVLGNSHMYIVVILTTVNHLFELTFS